MTKRVVRAAFMKSLPIMAGYIVLGIGFGILLQKSGFGVLWALCMSIVIYAGSMQYVGVSLLASGASLLVTAVTTLMVNARHLFYSISMLKLYQDAGKKKPYLIFSLTDETYSILCDGSSPKGEDAHCFRFLVSLFDQCYWVIGCVTGTLLGAVLPFDTTGIDFSMTALFVTVFVEQWKSTKQHAPALLGIAVTALCRLIFSADLFLIPAMIGISAGLLAMHGRLEPAREEGVSHD